MPRGKSNKKSQARQSQKTNGSNAPVAALKVIDRASFQKLCTQIRNHMSEADEARSTIGGLITSAVEKKHLHKKAFAMYRGLAKLSDAHLMTTLAHFDHYREIGGLDDRASRQGQLLRERPELDASTTAVVQFNQRQREQVAEFEPEAA